MSTREVSDLMAVLFADEADAHGILLDIGCPPSEIVAFHNARSFWPRMLTRLDNGLVPGARHTLLELAAERFPGNVAVRALCHRDGVPAHTGSPAVLALLTDPLRASSLRLDREARLLDEIARRDGLRVTVRHAVRLSDIPSAIRDTTPDIVHLGGHCFADGRLLFENDQGAVLPVGMRELATLMGTAGTRPLACVVLNSCFAGDFAAAFRGVARMVIGAHGELSDTCAQIFAESFYAALARATAPETAFAQAQAQLEAHGWAGADPRLLYTEPGSGPGHD